MSASPREPDRPTAATRVARKPLRFRIGVGLLVLYPLMWVFAAVVPFVALDAAAKATMIGADLLAAEVVFVLGVVCIGKEAYQAIKARLFPKKARLGEEQR